MLYYAKSTGGFYVSFIHGSAIPSDAVEITEEEHAELLAAQSNGCTIQADHDGRPVAVKRPEPSLGERRVLLCASIDQAADAARLAVAGDPLRAAEYQIAETEAKDVGCNSLSNPGVASGMAQGQGSHTSTLVGMARPKPNSLRRMERLSSLWVARPTRSVASSIVNPWSN